MNKYNSLHSCSFVFSEKIPKSFLFFIIFGHINNVLRTIKWTLNFSNFVDKNHKHVELEEEPTKEPSSRPMQSKQSRLRGQSEQAARKHGHIHHVQNKGLKHHLCGSEWEKNHDLVCLKSVYLFCHLQCALLIIVPQQACYITHWYAIKWKGYESTDCGLIQSPHKLIYSPSVQANYKTELTNK